MRVLRRSSLVALAALVFAGASARAADINVTLPNVSGQPGSLVDVPITVSPSPVGLGIIAINFRLAFNPSVVFTSYSLADGFLQNWGTPFWNGTGSYLAAATAGVSPLGSSSTLLNTVRVRIHPAAVPGTHMPLTFSVLQFNEGTPSVSFTPGDLFVTAPPLDVPANASRHLALAIASANPARDEVAFSFTVPGSSPAALAVYDVRGGLVWSSRVGDTAAEGGTRWNLRASSGERVGPGVYFARLAVADRAVTRRLVVLD